MDAEVHWLAGLLEGEGSFAAVIPNKRHGRTYPQIQFATVDEDVAVKVADLLDANVCGPYNYNPDQHQDIYKVGKCGQEAGHWMRRLYPLMGERRKEQIQEALSSATNEEELYE